MAAATRLSDTVRRGPRWRGGALTTPLFLLCVFSNLVHWSRAEISCYGCSHPTFNKTVKLCSNFEPSSEYKIRCPDSTFCMKKTSELDLLGGSKIRVEERKCAPQASKELQFENGRWVTVNVVEEKLYIEGCSREQTNLKAAKTEYCYCSSNYCNSGHRVTEMYLFHHTDAISVIFIFNVVKLMLSIC